MSKARPILVSVRSEPSSTVLVASIRNLIRFCEFQGIDFQEFAVEFEHRASLGFPIRSILSGVFLAKFIRSELAIRVYSLFYIEIMRGFVRIGVM